VQVSFKKLASVSQELTIDYAKNNARLAIFVEDVNWSPTSLVASSEAASVDPYTSFYNSALKSIGGMLKLGLWKTHMANDYVCGSTEVALPLIGKARLAAPQGQQYYKPFATMNVSSILHSFPFYNMSMAGPDAGDQNVSARIFLVQILNVNFVLSL
jgi:hypothetical protein